MRSKQPGGERLCSLQGKIFSAMPPAQQPDENVFMSLQQYSAKPERKKKVSAVPLRAASHCAPWRRAGVAVACC
jgi:hypothetical protein